MESELLDQRMKELQVQQLEHAVPDANWDDQFESEIKKSLKVILDDEFVENRLGNFPVWSMVSKTSKITFLDRIELSIFESHLESMICSYIMSIPPCMIDDDTLQLVDQARIVSRFNLRRASGTDSSNKINERILEATQIRQSYSTGGMGGFGSSPKPNFIKRLFGMR